MLDIMAMNRNLVISVEEGLEKTLRHINALRHSSSEDQWRGCHSVVEEIVETLFNASNHFAVYGSLAPGKTNHHMIENVPGKWLEGCVKGELYESGWGAGVGFPGIIWSPQGPKVPVKLFVSEHLPEHWERLDRFEGEEYRRSLIPVYDVSESITVANIYEIRR